MTNISEANILVLQDAVADAHREFMQALKDLKREAEMLQREMGDVAERAQKWIDGKPSFINERGEVQQRGRDINLLCAKVDARRQHWGQLTWILQKMEEDKD